MKNTIIAGTTLSIALLASISAQADTLQETQQYLHSAVNAQPVHQEFANNSAQSAQTQSSITLDQFNVQSNR